MFFVRSFAGGNLELLISLTNYVKPCEYENQTKNTIFFISDRSDVYFSHIPGTI